MNASVAAGNRGNPIGSGTRNVSVNVAEDFHKSLGRWSYRAKESSVGAFVRKLIVAGADSEYPELAAELRKAMKEHALLVVFTGILGFSALSDESQGRRSLRRAARGRVSHTRVIAGIDPPYVPDDDKDDPYRINAAFSFLTMEVAA